MATIIDKDLYDSYGRKIRRFNGLTQSQIIIYYYYFY